MLKNSLKSFNSIFSCRIPNVKCRILYFPVGIIVMEEFSYFTHYPRLIQFLKKNALNSISIKSLTNSNSFKKQIKLSLHKLTDNLFFSYVIIEYTNTYIFLNEV